MHQFRGAVADAIFTPHQLELFYYVAKHGGISAATRHMPYGIGQPAVSGQLTAMERRLGKRLFERKPFKLTDEGGKLFAHVQPFFDGLVPLWHQLRRELSPLLRIVADENIGARLAPSILTSVWERAPEVRFEFQRVSPDELEVRLGERDADVFIAPYDRRVAGMQCVLLAQLRLRLLVATKTKIASAGHFWQQGRIAERLLCPRESAPEWRTFQRGLAGLRVDWPAAVRADSAALITELVAGGQGVGLDLEFPDAKLPDGIRAIPLTGFDRVPLVMLWRKPVTSLVEPLLGAVREASEKLWPAAGES